MMQAIIARTPLRRVGIAGRDGIIAAFAVLLIAGGTGWVVYRSAVHGLENEVKSNLLSLANSAAALTDGDGLAQITEPEDRGSTLYEAVRDVVKGASCGCAEVFGATKGVESCGVPLLREHALAGTPGVASFRKYVVDGFQTYLF